MSDKLEYGISSAGKHNRLYVDVPHPVLQTMAERSLGAFRVLGGLGAKHYRYIDIEPNDAKARLYINTKKIGNTTDKLKREGGTKGVIGVLNAIDALTSPDQKDPKIEICPGTSHARIDGRMHMSARISWPKTTDQENIRIVTSYMRDAAHKLRFERKLIDGSVGCDISRERGVSMITNQPFAGTLCTEGNFYNPQDEVVELWQHNIYNETQQLILFVGAVAFANADNLIKSIATD